MSQYYSTGFNRHGNQWYSGENGDYYYENCDGSKYSSREGIIRSSGKIEKKSSKKRIEKEKPQPSL